MRAWRSTVVVVMMAMVTDTVLLGIVLAVVVVVVTVELTLLLGKVVVMVRMLKLRGLANRDLGDPAKHTSDVSIHEIEMILTGSAQQRPEQWPQRRQERRGWQSRNAS